MELRCQRLADVGAALTARASMRRPFTSDVKWIAALGATLVVILAVNPVGYLGGGLDDYRYLAAARCWVAHGPCLPANHWDARWPLVGALAASIVAFGESRFSVGLPTLIYSVACLALLTMVGNRLFKAPVGYLAALFLLTVPTFAVEILDPSVGSVELSLLLGSALCMCAYSTEHRRWQAFAAGLCWALACQVRETAIIGAIPLGLVFWRTSRADRMALAAASFGAILPFLAEALFFWWQTGDPFFRRTLSLGHTQIATTELSGRVDTRQSPLFNPAYIANWRREPGIHLHWTVDGLVNLLANLTAGVLLPLSLAFGLSYARRSPPPERLALYRCLALALLWACALIYAFAVDPKPRMMEVPLAVSAVTLSIILRRLERTGSRALAVVVGGITILIGLAITSVHPQIYLSQRAITQWAARYPDQIMTDQTGQNHLALMTVARTFSPPETEREYMVLRSDGECAALRPTPSNALYRPVGRSSLDRFGRSGFGYFCLLRRAGPSLRAQFPRH